MPFLNYRSKTRYAPYLFISPFVVLFLVFGLYPILRSLVLAFYITAGPRSQVFVGIDNFVFLFSDPNFYRALRNTCVYAFFSVLLQIPLSLGLALLLNQKRLRGRNFFRFVFFSPHLVGQVFVAVLFSVIFIPQFGLLNRLLQWMIGLDLDTKWLGNPGLVMPALVMTSLWMYVGFNMIYFLAALQAVDVELYDAAMVDGANCFQRFLHVTLPGIRTVTAFVLLVGMIGSFQLFELPFVMLNNSAGPDQAGLTLVMHLYMNGFVSGDLGYASAIGWTLAAGVFAVSLLQIRATRLFGGAD